MPFYSCRLPLPYFLSGVPGFRLSLVLNFLLIFHQISNLSSFKLVLIKKEGNVYALLNLVNFDFENDGYNFGKLAFLSAPAVPLSASYWCRWRSASLGTEQFCKIVTLPGTITKTILHREEEDFFLFVSL